MILLQGFGTAFDLGKTDVLGITTKEFPEVEFATLQGLRGDDLAAKATEVFALVMVLAWH